MKDFRVVRLNTGESFMCVVWEETDEEIDVLFPLMIRTQTIPVGNNTLREVHSTVQFCPFTDEKHFTFSKKLTTYVKPMADDAIEYYVDMLNRHEEEDVLKAYDLEDLVTTPKDLSSPQDEENDIEDMLQDDGDQVLH